MSKFGLVKSLLTFTPINQSPKILNQRIWNIVRYGQGDEIKYSYLNEGEIDPQIYKEIDLYQVSRAFTHTGLGGEYIRNMSR